MRTRTGKHLKLSGVYNFETIDKGCKLFEIVMKIFCNLFERFDGLTLKVKPKSVSDVTKPSDVQLKMLIYKRMDYHVGGINVT